MKKTINVLSGQKKILVGKMVLQVGMRTNEGEVLTISPGGNVITSRGRLPEDRRDNLGIRLTEARKFGYPDAAGCKRLREVPSRRSKKAVAA